MPRLRPLLLTLLLCLLVSASWSLLQASPLEPAEDPELQHDYGTDHDRDVVTIDWIESYRQPQLSEGSALFRLETLFPWLRNYGRPSIELLTYDTPAGFLRLYDYTWEELPGLLVQQDADTGDVLQYIDFDLLYRDPVEGQTPISERAGEMLATMRFESSRDAAYRRVYYPETPILQYDAGLYIYIWTKEYYGIPNYDEQFIVAIDAYSGMPVLFVEQNDYSLAAEATLPAGFLSPSEALELTLSYIDPVLLWVEIEEHPDTLVWFSGITISAFYADGSDLLEMDPEPGVEQPADIVLTVSKEEAAQRFAEALTLELEWYAVTYEDPYYGEVAVLEPVYFIELTPIDDDYLAVIPAVLSDEEFIAQFYGFH